MTSLSTTINLVTPPSSPAPVAEDNAGDGERGKRKVKDESLPLYDSDDSVVEMSQPKKQRTFASSSSDVASSSSCDQDDECTIVGTHGHNALVDFVRMLDGIAPSTESTARAGLLTSIARTATV